MHNALQGDDINLSELKRDIYEEVVFENAARMHLDHDLVIVHDPQPLPLIDFFRKNQPWVWRCPSALALLDAAPGGILLFDPVLSDYARDAVLTAAAAAGAQVILYTQWHHAVANRILAATKVVVPLDIVCPNLEDIPERLVRLLDAPYAHSVPTLTIENVADAIQRLPVDERALIVDAFVGPRTFLSAPALAETHGFELRTFERHLGKAGLVPPSDILRCAGVARAREMLASSAASLAVIAERCGLRTESGVVHAFHWCLALPPHEAVRSLDSYEFSRQLADRMRRA